MNLSAPRLGRLPRLFSSLFRICFFCFTGWSSAAGVLTFDEIPEGPLASNAILGTAFSGGASVYWAGKSNHAVSAIGSFSITFADPQQRVKIWVGNPGSIAGQYVQLTAYADTKAGPALVSTRTYVTNTGTAVPLEIFRVLSGDIKTVVISGTSFQFDNVEFENSMDKGAVSLLTFDDEDLLNQVIHRQYRGIEFLQTAGNAVSVRPIGASTITPPYGLVTHEGEVGNPGFIKFWLSPAQGAVRFRAGNPWSGSDIQMTVRAYWLLNSPPLYLLMPLATNVVTLKGYAGATNVIEISDWAGRSIEYVEIESSHNLWEAIDNLEFAPNAPDGTADTTPPVIAGFAVNGTSGALSLWRSSSQTNVTVTGTIQESVALRSIVAYSRNPVSQVLSSNSVPFQRNSAGDYTFEFGPIMITPGTNQVWVVAIDSAGNVSAPSSVVSVIFDYPRSQVSSVSPLTGAGGLLLRRTGAYPVPNAYGITNAALNPVITVTGSDLHEHMRVSIHVPQPSGGYTAHGVMITNRSASLTSMTGVVPEAALAMPGDYEIQVTDHWPGNYHTNWTGIYSVTTDHNYTKLWGFGFRNKHHTGSLEPEYWSCFGWNAYTEDGFLGIGGCARTPLSWLFWPIYRDNAPQDGSCVGLAAMTQLMHDDFERTGVSPSLAFNSDVLYPNGLIIDPLRPSWQDFASNTPPTLPPGIHWPPCAPPYPTDLWGTIRTHFAVQFSAEYIAASLDQIDFFDGTDTFFRGDPAARLADLRSNGPMRYVIAMTPGSGSGGHAVAPYAVVGNRIYVADNNKPYASETGADYVGNQQATNSYVDIDPVSNTYTFPNLGWSGDGLYIIPLDIWRNEKHLPFSFTGLMNMLQGWFFGAADPLYTTADGNQSLGWDKTGKFINRMPGAKALPFFGSTNDHRNLMVLLPTNHTTLSVQAHVRSNANYGFLAAWKGRIAQCEAMDAAGDETSSFGLTTVGAQLTGLKFESALEGARFVPKLGRVHPGTGVESVFQWGGMKFSKNEGAESRFTESPHGAGLVNLGSKPLRPILVFETNEDPAKRTSVAFGPFDMPPGAAFRVTVTEFTNTPRATAEIDVLRNGNYSKVGEFVGFDTRAQLSGGPDCNQNGILDLVDIALGTSADSNGDGFPDECQGFGNAPRLEQIGLSPKGNLKLFVKGMPGSRFVVEQSSDLTKWSPVFTNTASTGAMEFEDPSPVQNSKTRYYRAFQARP